MRFFAHLIGHQGTYHSCSGLQLSLILQKCGSVSPSADLAAAGNYFSDRRLAAGIQFSLVLLYDCVRF